jgi:pimeloyl-ACP methyl ester carboxylesterase
MREKVVLFGQNRSLVGIVTESNSYSSDAHLPAVIILNAGLLHRIGPNRLHVKIARRMAGAGFSVLRFDFSGIGDSRPRNDNLPFEKSSISETQEAMNYISSIRNIRRFVLIGLCSGANVAFGTACRDRRVVGAIGVNGSYLDSQESERLSLYVNSSIQERYYRKRVLNYRSWLRLITGKSDLRGVMKYFATKAGNLLSRNTNVRVETDSAIEWNSLAERGVESFLIFSEGSKALDTYRLLLEKRINELRPSGRLSVKIVDYSDHVFTLLWSQEVLMDSIEKWARNEKRSWISD